MPNLQLVTVSKWLEGEVKKSFLKNLQCTTIYNGIDLNVFKPTDSDFRKKYGIEDKVIILGVASTWDVITMSAGCRHTVIAETELKLIEVQLGEAIDVHDKQKFELEY